MKCNGVLCKFYEVKVLDNFLIQTMERLFLQPSLKQTGFFADFSFSMQLITALCISGGNFL